MKEIVKNFSISDIDFVDTENSNDFFYAEIWLIGAKNNSHHNPISEEVLMKYGDTALGKWIVSDIRNGEATSHTETQKIIGVIPSDSEIKYKRNKDGELFIVADAVLSKIYNVDAWTMFNEYNHREVSCEFLAKEGKPLSNGDVPIEAFDIKGVTILGSYKNGIHASCKGAEMFVTKFSEEAAEKYYKSFEKQDSLKTFAEKRTEELKLVSHPIDKSKESIDMGDWNGDKAKHDLIKEKNFKTLAKSVCAKLEDGWQERKVTALGYPIMNLKDGKWVYNAEGLSSALEYSAQHDESVHKKVIEIQKKLGLYKEEEMAEEKDLNFSESENDKEEKDIVMEEDKEKEEVSETVEEEKEDESEKEMGCQEEMAEETKKFSLDAYVDAGAILALLEIESEQHRELANKVLKEMSAESIIMEFVAMAKELDGFKEEKAKAEKEKTDKKLFSIMTPAKEKLSVDMFVKLYEEGKTLTFDELDAFTNKVKAFVDENKVSTSEEDGLMMFGASDNTKKEQENIDVFEKLSRKYN